MYKCVWLVCLWTLSYLLPLWSPPLCLQQASGNKETSALWLHPEAPLWHSDSTSYLPPSTSVSPVWPVAGSLMVKGWSPCTGPPGGDTGMEKSITIHFYIQLKGDNAYNNNLLTTDSITQYIQITLQIRKKKKEIHDSATHCSSTEVQSRVV